MEDRKVSGIDKIVLIYLARYNPSFPSQLTMAKDLRLDPKTIRKSIGRLTVLGYIKKQKYKRGFVYHLSFRESKEFPKKKSKWGNGTHDPREYTPTYVGKSHPLIRLKNNTKRKRGFYTTKEEEGNTQALGQEADSKEWLAELRKRNESSAKPSQQWVTEFKERIIKREEKRSKGEPVELKDVQQGEEDDVQWLSLLEVPSLLL